MPENPQIENGFVKIANELYDHLLKVRFSDYEHRVLHAIIRKTYGWNKKADMITLSQISKMTGIATKHCARTLSNLKNRNIITRNNGITGINKYFSKWVLPIQGVPIQGVPIQGVPKQGTGTPYPGNKALPIQGVPIQGVPIQGDTKDIKDLKDLKDIKDLKGLKDIKDTLQKTGEKISTVSTGGGSEVKGGLGNILKKIGYQKTLSGGRS